MDVQWEATDQFGNLYVGMSSATSFAQLSGHVQDLAEKLKERFPDGPIVITIDFEYGEINGPDPEGVSHVLQTPWITDQTEIGPEEMAARLAEATGLPVQVA